MHDTLSVGGLPHAWACTHNILAGQPLLLPLTESLYVSGTLESVDTVLLEIGTGYYVEVRWRRRAGRRKKGVSASAGPVCCCRL